MMRSSEQVKEKKETIESLLAEAEAAGGSPELLSLMRQTYMAARRGDKAASARISAEYRKLRHKPESLFYKKDPEGWLHEKRAALLDVDVRKGTGGVTEGQLDPGQVLERAIDDERKTAWQNYGEQIDRATAMKRLQARDPEIFRRAQNGYKGART